MENIMAEARTRILQHTRPTAVTPPPSPPPGRIEDEDDPLTSHFLMCPVHLREYDCEEHLPHVIFPCGHTVCREACVRETRCPLCRTSFRNHALNRGLLEVMRTINRPTAEGVPKLSENKFLQALQMHRQSIETMRSPNRLWSERQWNIFHELLTALKEHANVATQTWIDAAGLDYNLAAELKRKLIRIRRVIYNRRILGWEDIEMLPMSIA